MAKLSQDVLGAVPEKQFSLEDIQFVLSDALVLLACKEIIKEFYFLKVVLSNKNIF